MRILIVSEDIPYPSMGGLAKHVLTLARALVRAGHHVDLLGGTQHPPEVAGSEIEFGGRFFGELDGHISGWKEVPLGVYNPLRRPWIARHFARIIMRRAAGYDVVHYHGHIPNVGMHIPEHINFIQTRHDQGSDCLTDTRFRNGQVCAETDPACCASCKTANPNFLQLAVSTAAVRRYREEVAKAFSRHKTVFVSEMLHRNLTRTLGDRRWGTVLHNFADIGDIRAARDAAAARPRTDERFHVFMAGKLYPAKGIAAFLNEFVPRMRSDMRVTVVGDGVDAPALKAAFESENVRFAGWCAMRETLELAAGADAIVVPSVWEEPFGSTTLEGLLLGKPTFALDRGATPELGVYASAPDQLRLYPDMRSLADGVLAASRQPDYGPPEYERACVDQAVHKLVQLYRLPPGPTLN